jgi:hypothetical protein
LAGERPRRRKARGDADDHAEHDQAQSRPKRHGQHVPAGRAERHADADLLGLARDVVGDHAVDAQDDEREAETGESAEDEEAQAWFRVRELLEELGQCP